MNCSGGPLEGGLRRVISDIRVGSLLVQSDAKTGELLLLHVMLPCCIRDRERAKEARPSNEAITPENPAL